MRLGVKAALVDGQLVHGDVSIDGEHVDAVGLSPAGGTGLAVPGLIDLQINGFDGVDFTSVETDDYRHVARRLAATGVTSFQPTLISLPTDQYLAALERLDPTAIKDARILGMHLEGPFLSPVRCGAHDPQNMIHPDLTLAQQFLDTGHFTHMTIAPELPGALELIDFLSTRGVTVALGHTDCDADTATTAFDRGARSVTHIFGAQRPWGHRGRPNELLNRDPSLVHASVASHIGYPGGHVEGYPDTFRALFAAVYTDIASGEPAAVPNYPTFADGHDSLLVAEAVARSASEQRWIPVDR